MIVLRLAGIDAPRAPARELPADRVVRDEGQTLATQARVGDAYD